MRLKKEDMGFGYNELSELNGPHNANSDGAQSLREKLKRNPIIGLGVLGIILILWFLSGLFQTETKGVQTSLPLKEQNQQKSIMRVSVVESSAQTKEIFYTVRGHTQADQKVTLKAEASGQVVFVTAKGQSLKKGQPIVRLATEDRLARLQAARALVDQTKLEYEAARKLGEKLYKSKTAVAEKKARYDAALASLDTIQQEYKNISILAPFDGTADERFVDIGDYVSVGQTISSFVHLDPLLVVVHVAEQYIQDIRKNEIVKVILYDGSVHQGEVRFVSKIAEPQTRSYRVEVTIPNPHNTIPDGVTAEARITISNKKVHRVVPSILSLNDEGDAGVKAVNDEGIVNFYPININNHDETGLWVDGLPEKAKIIVKGQDFVKVGQKVEPVMMGRESERVK